MSRTAAQVRQDFIDFFTEKHAHTFAASSPVVPHDDPTLLFTNAGMNQFKDVFLGRGARDYTRAVNSQKCIRAGGKHNDLEDVGRDSYHHTFFEMLGNWSFGDFFKEEAIAWAWELLTEVWGLDPTRLHATVFAGDSSDGLEADTEAETIWRKYLPDEHITRHAKKENFWEMGDTGPCGPCSELHYDGTPDRTGGILVNQDDPRVIEIWNLVFIQYERGSTGALAPLPARHVDTGMGFERILRVLQDKDSNYDTDLWTPIFDAIAARTGVRAYGADMTDPIDTAYRILADHIRCLVSAICDGASPSSDGRGYVLRRILRRAVRHARQTLGAEGPVLCDLVPSVVTTLGTAFPEIAAKADHATSVIRAEEEAFLRTLDRGIDLFDEAAARAESNVISAGDAFRLHDTYGFPIDLTRVMAEERGMTVDEAGYDAEMEVARSRSRGSKSDERRLELGAEAIGKLESLTVRPTESDRRDRGAPITTRVAAIWNGTDFDEHAGVGSRVGIVFDSTNHYAEAGGQVADHGTFDVVGGAHEHAGFRVDDVQRFGAYVLHIGDVTGDRLSVGDEGELRIKRARRASIEPNHTVTHLLNHALREVIGEESDQRGSLVEPERLRFDYACRQAPSPKQLIEIERRVRANIESDRVVDAAEAPLAKAMEINGVRAVFGERYPDPVRVVSIGATVESLIADPSRPEWKDCSVEFCGGTHLQATAAADDFVLLSEGGLAAGIRRIVGLTGVPAKASRTAASSLEAEIEAADELSGSDLVEAFAAINTSFESLPLGVTAKHRIGPKIESLRSRVKKAKKADEASARSGITDTVRAIADDAPGPIVIARIDGAGKQGMLTAVDVMRAKRPECAAIFFDVDDEASKVGITAIVPKELIATGLKAGDWARAAAEACGGRGGGRPDMAQAGGKDPSRIDEAMAAADSFAHGVIG